MVTDDSKTNIEKIRERFIDQPYDSYEITTYLESLGYSQIEKEFSEEGERIYRFLDLDSPRTLFVTADGHNIVKTVTLYYSHVQRQSKENTSISHILVPALMLGLIGWFIFSVVSNIIDSNNEEYNPYTEDFDGDGLKGDKDDHDILHNMDTLPTEP